MSDEITHSQDPTQRKTVEERAEALARLVASQVARGRRVESQSNLQAVLIRGHRPNHILHLILTALTLGFWGLVWIGMMAFGGERRELVRVDEWGNVSIEDLGRA